MPKKENKNVEKESTMTQEAEHTKQEQTQEQEQSNSFSTAAEWLEEHPAKKAELEAKSIDELRNEATKIDIIKKRRADDRNRQLDESLVKRKNFVDYLKRENPNLKGGDLLHFLRNKMEIVLRNEGIYITGRADNKEITVKDIEEFRRENQKEIETLRKNGKTKQDGTELETHVEFLDRMQKEGKLTAVVANFEMLKENKQENINKYYQTWLMEHPADQKDLEKKSIEELKDELTKHAIRNTRRAEAFDEQLKHIMQSSKGRAIAERIKKANPALENKEFNKKYEKALNAEKIYPRSNLQYSSEITNKDIAQYRIQIDPANGRNLHAERLERLETEGKDSLTIECAKIRKESTDNYMSVRANRDAIDFLQVQNPLALAAIENR
jgi:hypothetical protein